MTMLHRRTFILGGAAAPSPSGWASPPASPPLTAARWTARQDRFAVAVSPWAEVAVRYTDDNDGNTFDQIMLGLGATDDDGAWPGGTIAAE